MLWVHQELGCFHKLIHGKLSSVLLILRHHKLCTANCALLGAVNNLLLCPTAVNIWAVNKELGKALGVSEQEEVKGQEKVL